MSKESERNWEWNEKNKLRWEQFAAHFDEINKDFIKKLKSKFPTVNKYRLKVCTICNWKLATKEIASDEYFGQGSGDQQYRLRKKLQLPAGEALNGFLSYNVNGREAWEITRSQRIKERSWDVRDLLSSTTVIKGVRESET